MKNPYLYSKVEIKSTVAQDAIRKALIELLLQNGLEQISVKKLCAKAHVARSTFYVYYENLKDVLSEVENHFINKLAELDHRIVNKKKYIEPNDFSYFSEIIDYVSENEVIIQALLIRSYDYSLVSKWKQAIKYQLFSRLQPRSFTIKDQLLFEMTASEVISAFIFYLEHTDEIAQDDIYKLISQQLLNLNADL